MLFLCVLPCRCMLLYVPRLIYSTNVHPKYYKSLMGACCLYVSRLAGACCDMCPALYIQVTCTQNITNPWWGLVVFMCPTLRVHVAICAPPSIFHSHEPKMVQIPYGGHVVFMCPALSVHVVIRAPAYISN